jgi:hypothetical protein
MEGIASMDRLTRTILALLLLTGFAEVQGLYEIDTIRTIEVTVTPNWRTEMENNYASKTYIKATIKIDGKVYTDVGVRHKGYSTYHFLPYKWTGTPASMPMPTSKRSRRH